MKEINKFSEVSEEYDALICDVWGVIHNGKELFLGINECLKNYMEKDGVIVLLSNAPSREGDFIKVKAVLE